MLLFLWGVNPNNLAYSLLVLAQSGFLVGFAAAALLLPILTVVWIGWLQQLVRNHEWARVRRVLPAITCLGYVALIAPGYYLHEMIHLLDTPIGPAPVAEPMPAAD